MDDEKEKSGISVALPSAVQTRSRKLKERYQVDEQVRRVKTYPFSTTEIIGLSVLNPAAAGLLGWGVNMLIAWTAMAPSHPERHTFCVGAVAVVVCGAVLQLISWGLIVKVWRECRK